MRRTLAALTAALALVALGPIAASADSEGSATQSAVPQIEPVVLGEVTQMNAHQVTVRTADGEVMPFEFDSRTVMPLEMGAGTRVRVDFHLLDSGLHLARRINVLTIGSRDWDTLDHALAVAATDESQNESGEGEIAVASYPDTKAREGAASEPATEMSQQQASAMDEAQAAEAPSGASESAAAPEDLPDTASDLPLVLGAGLLLLAAAAGLRWMRRRTA